MPWSDAKRYHEFEVLIRREQWPLNCPSCGKPTQQDRAPDGSASIFCPQCGWGRDDGSAQETGDSDKPPIWAVGAMWALAALVCFGPYVALRLGIPALLDIGPQAFDDATDRLMAILNVHYWWVMAIYVFLCGVFSPTYDPDKVGLFGGLVDNPLSWEDDFERQKRAWAFFLLPGKSVWMACILTRRLIAPPRS
jgi:hypothetical protein